MNKPESFLDGVRDYALNHYEESGWDYVVECFSDQELLDVIGDAPTIEKAVARVQARVKLLDERRKDVQSEIF